MMEEFMRYTDSLLRQLEKLEIIGGKKWKKFIIDIQNDIKKGAEKNAIKKIIRDQKDLLEKEIKKHNNIIKKLKKEVKVLKEILKLLGDKTGDEENADEKELERKCRILARLRLKADQAEAQIVYSKLFGEIGPAVQKLFALAKEEEERETYERILEEEIQLPIKEAFQNFQVEFKNGKISLPDRKVEPEQDLTERLKGLSWEEMKDAVKECKGRIARARIYERPKGAIDKAADSLRRLTETPAAELDRRRMKELAAEIEEAFCKSGIYPLFRRDRRILERPDLCSLFIEVRGKALIWPGLFMEVDGKLQMYGNFQGTCRRGEWNNENG